MALQCPCGDDVTQAIQDRRDGMLPYVNAYDLNEGEGEPAYVTEVNIQFNCITCGVTTVFAVSTTGDL